MYKRSNEPEKKKSFPSRKGTWGEKTRHRVKMDEAEDKGRTTRAKSNLDNPCTHDATGKHKILEHEWPNDTVYIFALCIWCGNYEWSSVEKRI